MYRIVEFEVGPLDRLGRCLCGPAGNVAVYAVQGFGDVNGRLGLYIGSGIFTERQIAIFKVCRIAQRIGILRLSAVCIEEHRIEAGIIGDPIGFILLDHGLVLGIPDGDRQISTVHLNRDIVLCPAIFIFFTGVCFASVIDQHGIALYHPHAGGIDIGGCFRRGLDPVLCALRQRHIHGIPDHQRILRIGTGVGADFPGGRTVILADRGDRLAECCVFHADSIADRALAVVFVVYDQVLQIAAHAEALEDLLGFSYHSAPIGHGLIGGDQVVLEIQPLGFDLKSAVSMRQVSIRILTQRRGNCGQGEPHIGILRAARPSHRGSARGIAKGQSRQSVQTCRTARNLCSASDRKITQIPQQLLRRQAGNAGRLRV